MSLKINPSCKYSFLTIVFCLYAVVVSAQDKFEKEYKITENEVPVFARNFMDETIFTEKIKWYKEENKNRISFEAKTTIENKKYSIEFNRNGEIEDIEIETEHKKLENTIKQEIENYLEQTFSKYRIRKIQNQYSGNREELSAFLKNGILSSTIVLQYEIVLKAKDKDGWALYEYLFSDAGNFIKKQRIVFRNTDNLKY